MLAYWKLLMRDRLMALAPSGRRREGQAAWKAVLGWAGITLLAVSLFAMAVLFEMVMYDQAKAMGEPQAVIALAFLACTLMTLIYSFFYVISLLFFGRDCAFVGALPIPSHGVLLAKLATVLAGEIGLTALVCLPLLIRYGVETGAAADYYVRSLLGTLFIPGIPVAITTLLSFALIRISALWKRREGVTTVMTFVLVAAIVGVEMSINMNMDEGELAQAAAGLLLGSGSLTELVLGAFPPLQWLTTAATGSGLHAWGQAALYAGVSIAALALVVALCGGEINYYLLITVLFLFCGLITQFMSNTAACALLAPIGLQIAQGLGVAPKSVLIVVAAAACSSYLTPMATPPNTLVFGCGGFRFQDFLKAGMPLFLLTYLLCILIVPAVWPI